MQRARRYEATVSNAQRPWHDFRLLTPLMGASNKQSLQSAPKEEMTETKAVLSETKAVLSD